MIKTKKFIFMVMTFFIFLSISNLVYENNESIKTYAEKTKEVYTCECSSQSTDTYIEKPTYKSTELTEPYTVELKEEPTEDTFQLSRYIKLGVEELLQNPELPTGCESVSLTAMLNYYEFELSKTYIVDNYLIYSNTGYYTDGYVGNPYTYEGAGCFSDVMTKVANNFLSSKNSNLKAYDCSGITLENMYKLLSNGCPILIWSTIDMEQPEIDKSHMEVGDYEFYYKEHCVVLIGYDLENNIFFVMDPMEGIVQRDINDFYDIYCKIGKYAMIIQNN